jgi:hypothetical protein
LSLKKETCSGYAALGFTKHLMGNLDEAIDSYHQALGCKPEDPFSTEMLNKALTEALNSFCPFSIEDENTIPNHPHVIPVGHSLASRFGSGTVGNDQSFRSKDNAGMNIRGDDGANLSMESDVDMSVA